MKLAEIFTDNLVLQAKKPIRVFGEAESDVTVTLAGRSVTVKPEGGKFLAELPAMPYGGPYTLTVESGDEKITLEDVYVGEVILFSGQSNIQFHMKDEITAPDSYADDELLRIFVSLRIENEEKIHPWDGWVKAQRDNIDWWAALAYLVGKRVREKSCAVGVIACSQGASVIQAWIERSLIAGSPLDLPTEVLAHGHTDPLFKKWNARGRLYDYMLSRLIPLSVGSVVWYQGESNASPAEGAIYVELLRMLIENWREKFRANLHFTVVQLADFNGNSEGWRLVQAAQLEAERVIPNVSTVICRDFSESDDIHPRTKWKLADRIYDSLCANKLI